MGKQQEDPSPAWTRAMYVMCTDEQRYNTCYEHDYNYEFLSLLTFNFKSAFNFHPFLFWTLITIQQGVRS